MTGPTPCFCLSLYQANHGNPKAGAEPANQAVSAAVSEALKR